MKCVEDSGIRRVGKTNRKEKVWRVKNVWYFFNEWVL
jgi:hypothetical protein